MIEVFGAEGTMTVPDPNTFGGPVRLRHAGHANGRELPLTYGHTENSRGIGVADLAYAMRTGRPHRANADLAYHVLDVMHAILEASATGKHIELASTCERPAPLPFDLAERELNQ